MKPNELTRLLEEHRKILSAIETQKSLKDDMPENVFQVSLSALYSKRDALNKRIGALAGPGVDPAKVGKDDMRRRSGDIQAKNIHASDVIAGNKYHIEHKYGETTPEADPAILRKRYLERVIEDTGILTLQSIDPKSAACESESCLNLDAVYTALLTQSTDHEKGGPDFRESDDRSKLSALALLDRHPRMALLGDPGSGKTTFVNFIAYCLAGEILGLENANIDLLTRPLPDDDGEDRKERQPWRHGALIPVRVVLRDFTARGFPKEEGCAEDLWKFIEDEFKRTRLGNFAPHLEQELKKTGGLLLLDGLDEVPESENRRTGIKNVVEDFMKTFKRCRILITSRTYAYQNQEWRLPGFFETVLLPFSEGQIIRFVERWYAHIAASQNMDPENAKAHAELLKQAILNNRRLYELAERPLLLTLMASLHAWRGGSLPEKREELYADAVDLLLDRWESRKVRKDPAGNVISEPGIAEFLKTEKDKVRRKLNELAFEVHQTQAELEKTADIPEDKLVCGLLSLTDEQNAVDPRPLIRFLEHRAGLLIQRGEKIYTFPHRSIQEYLAACHLTDLDFPVRVAELARKEPDRWREAALLAGAKAARGSETGIWLLANALCFRHPVDAKAPREDSWGALLAGQALVESADLKNISDRNRVAFGLIRDWLAKVIEGNRLPAVERAAAGRHLAVLGDPRTEVMTLKHMQFCRVPAGAFQMGNDESLEEEKPLHLNEHLKYAYWVSRHTVTCSQYAEFVRAGGYASAEYWKEAENAGLWKPGKYEEGNEPEDYGLPFNFPNHPVVGVSWYEALAFTRWLTDLWRRQGILDTSRRIRLPSEAEWEKAARGGQEIPETPLIVAASEAEWEKRASTIPNPWPARTYPWGDEMARDSANFNETGIGTTSAAGCFSSGASPCGCQDMAGNVWEWTRSLWGEDFSKPEHPYPYVPHDGREDETAINEILRVLRGGSFGISDDNLRCADRGRLYPGYRVRDRGFRVVCAPN